jgi:choline dehydrogenase
VEAGRRVLLLEAGRDERAADVPPQLRSIDPRAGLIHEVLDVYSWPDLVATRTAAQEPWRYTRGRGLGGSSLINSIIAIRATVEDFDEWAAAGCEGWGYDDVLPLLRRLEDDLQFPHDPHHGGGGPVPVHRMPLTEWGEVDLALREAALSLGFPWADDLHAPGATGVSAYPVNVRNRQRVTSADGYLEPLRDSPLLEIHGDSVVDTVVLENGRATGVRLVGGDVLRAERVVLAGGVIGSPTILQRSGIGPRTVLEPLGIDVRADLPVGRGMSDHAVIPVVVPLREGAQATPGERPFSCCVRYASGLDGLTNDMLVISVNGGQLFGTQLDLDPSRAGGLWVWVNRAFSRGSVEITSSDPNVPPLIRHELLSDARDLERLREGVRLVARLVENPAVRDLCDGDPWAPDGPNGALGSLLDDDAGLDRYLLENVIDTNHATSTCRMGPAGDPDAVVDPSGRVHGVDGLAVADASILPYCPRANTHMTAVLAGEIVAARA